MSTELLLISISVVILVAYVLDILSSRTRIPPIIFMLVAGIFIRVAADRTGVHIPYVGAILPVLGTVGLILIVLDAGLDLDLAPEKLPLIRGSLLSAFSGLALTTAALTGFFHFFLGEGLRVSLINAIPFAIISSAIAIPGARYLPEKLREFVIYESSFSDILGILLFNLAVFNANYGILTLLSFSFEIALTAVLSVGFSLILTILIGKIRHKIKFLPIFSMLILAYAVAKKMHFSPLLLVLIFGLMLNNFHLVIRGELRKHLDPEVLHNEVRSFNSLISELTFVVKIFFFLLLGYSVQVASLLDYRVVVIVALPMLLLIYASRYAALAGSKREFAGQIVYYAPRGLITILLFMAIPPELKSGKAGEGLMVWLILATSVIMTYKGIISRRKPAEDLSEAGGDPGEPGVASPQDLR